MLLAFWLKNLNFALELSSAITLILAAFLLFDSWTVKKELKTGLQGTGYFVLAIFFILTSTNLNFPNSEFIILIVKLIALVLLFAGLLIDRLNPVPKLVAVVVLIPLYLSSPILFFAITVLYFLKATKGYEKNVIWVAASFFFFSLSDVIGSLGFLGESKYLVLRQFYAQYSLGFYLQSIFLLIGFAILFLWSLGYLRFRLLSQMFLYLTVGSLAIFLITTFTFTSFLLGNLEQASVDNLTTSGKSFEYSLTQLEDKALITARALGTNNSLKASIKDRDRASTYSQIADFFFPTKGDSLVITDEKGVVIATSEDKDKFGNSISGKSVVDRARNGFDGVKITQDNRNGQPRLIVEAASPIKSGSTVLGTAVATYSVDNFFVDNVKSITGLDVTVYAGEVKAATTFLAPNGKDRLLGSEETNPKVTKQVLSEGKQVSTIKKIFGRDYSSVFIPIKNVDGKAAGMVFVGRPASEIIATADKSINLTFLFTAILTMLSIVPAYFIASFIARNQKA